MSTIVVAPEELLARAMVLAEFSRNLEIMDSAAILHGYLELTRLDPNNDTYRKDVEEAAANLLQATCKNCGCAASMEFEMRLLQRGNHDVNVIDSGVVCFPRR